ncbi:MAG: di-trans,poly-cis-decaprenylcistransferase [Flavobacteriaceae bacterium TMED265]|nr:MAG: di-trans,poly-cis-decaprenylcistransferase [Flavobacteriaceae bacterium TMED265]
MSETLPRHLAVIMDGNGRWATGMGRPRALGHEEGAKMVKRFVKHCAKMGIEYLTLFAFSTENWLRPKKEVNTLMRILVKSLRSELQTLVENDIQLRTIGDTKNLPQVVQSELEEVFAQTKSNTRMVLTLALSYGSRQEITSAMQEISAKVKKGLISPTDIDEKLINSHLYTCFMPEVDLLIRTSGEFRLSNFMLWQCAYAELYFTDTYWPDFDTQELDKALASYQKRERRFGKTTEQLQEFNVNSK